MAKNTNYFEHESFQDKESIVNYLEAITLGIKKGEIVFSDEEETVTIVPKNIGQLRIKSTRSKKSQEIKLKLSWSNHSQEDQEDTPLFIKAKKQK